MATKEKKTINDISALPLLIQYHIENYDMYRVTK